VGLLCLIGLLGLAPFLTANVYLRQAGHALERLTFALGTPCGSANSPPGTPPSQGGDRNAGGSRSLSPPCEGGVPGGSSEQVSSVCNATVRRPRSIPIPPGAVRFHLVADPGDGARPRAADLRPHGSSVGMGSCGPGYRGRPGGGGGAGKVLVSIAATGGGIRSPVRWIEQSTKKKTRYGSEDSPRPETTFRDCKL
jgi:hypothetical protein